MHSNSCSGVPCLVTASGLPACPHHSITCLNQAMSRWCSKSSRCQISFLGKVSRYVGIYGGTCMLVPNVDGLRCSSAGFSWPAPNIVQVTWSITAVAPRSAPPPVRTSFACVCVHGSCSNLLCLAATFVARTKLLQVGLLQATIASQHAVYSIESRSATWQYR
jgi:hypothetical protein